MGLSSDIISQFVKVTNKKEKKKTESTVYGTAVKYEGKMYVKLDGSDLLTPVSTTVDAEDGERVTVTIKDHSATVTGNTSSPSARTDDVKDIGNKISEFEIIIADKVSTDELEAESARIDELVSENVIIKQQLTADSADIRELEAENVTIKEKLTAAEAEIENLETTKLSTEVAEITYATIDELDATDAYIHNLEGSYADFKDLTTNKFTAVEGDIQDLDTKKLDAESAKIIYANIDFTNIGEAAIREFYAKSGVIQDVVISDGHVTGKLVGVTIKGDLIEGNTIVAEKLVIKGENGLYYKLNTNGESLEANQTEYNSLNGSIITAHTITAEKVNVDDLVAFDATIGGFNITSNSIYSGVKSSIGNTTRGIYLDNTGQVAFGDSNNFLKYFLDTTTNTWKLEISAQTIKMGGSSKTVEQEITDIHNKVDSIEIGGRNLFEKTSDYWKDITISQWSGNPTYYVDGISKSGVILPFSSLGLKVGDSYTISVELKAINKPISLRVDLYKDGVQLGNGYTGNYGNIIPIGETGISSYTGKVLADKPNLIVYIANRDTTNHTTNTVEQYRCLKIEKGNQVTDWSPAPADYTNKLTEFSESVTSDIENLQSQIDGNITTWFYNYEPSTSNAPASSWTTTDLKNQHLGDLFYIIDDTSKAGRVYRWALISGVYKWIIVEDVDVTKALADASKAQDTADSKRRVFITQPTPPYDSGDLWVQGSSGDIMRCSTSRTSGSYNSSDWTKASKYTDDTVANKAQTGVNLLSGDASNYSQLNDSTASYWGFTADTTPDGHWYTVKSLGRDIFLSNYYECSGGEKLSIDFEISTSCKADISNPASGTIQYAGTAVGIYGFNDSGTSVGISYSSRTTGTEEATVTKVSSIVTVNTNARKFRVFLQTDAWSSFSGSIKIRNLRVKKCLVQSTDVEYYLSTSNSSLSGGSWSTTAPAWVNSKYMWSRTKTILQNGTIIYNPSENGTCIAGATGSTGATGATGTGIESITEEYYLSTSKTTQTGGSWVTTPPTWSSGKYIWSRSKIVYKNPASTVYTTPVCSSEWEAVNELKVGGRNYIRNGKGDVKQGFFKNFNKVENGYGELTLKSKKTYTSINISDGYILKCRDYEVGKKVVFSFDMMFTAWNFPSGTATSEWWIGQRYSGGTSESSDGAWRGVTNQFTPPKVGVNGCELNKWVHCEYVMTIPTKAHSSIGTASSIQFYNNNSDVEASMTFRIKNVKLEYGNKATDWSPAPEDVQEQIDNLEIGSRNYFKKGTNITLYDSTDEGTAYPNTLDREHSECPNGFYLVGGRGSSGWLRMNNVIDSNGYWTISFWVRGSQNTPVHFTIDICDNGSTLVKTTGDNTWKKIAYTVNVANYTSDTYNFVDFSDIHWAYFYIKDIKIEKGNRATDWTPAPEDIQNGIDSAQDTANNAISRVSGAEQTIDSILAQISSLVTDANGTSLMTQTSTGWTFSTAQIQNSVNSVSNSLGSLSSSLGGTQSTVTALQQAVNDLEATAEYVHIGTYQSEPCIELGEKGSNFKLLITNTRIMFMEGSNNPTYIDSKGLNTKNIAIENDLRQGYFVTTVRENGNRGTTWVGGRNFALDSKTGWTSTEYNVIQGWLSTNWVEGRTYTVTIKGTVNSGNSFGLWRDSGSSMCFSQMPYISSEGVFRNTFVCPNPYSSGYQLNRFSIYNVPSSTATNAKIEWIKIEEGSTATPWSPAPEDVG